MSWSKPLRSMVFAGLALGLATSLGACSFAPVYTGPLASQPMLNLAYAKPNSRLEQVVYQELALRFGSSDAATAPLATVSVSSSAADTMLSATANPSKAIEVTVTATLTITARDGSTAPAQSFTRMATASYTRNGQVLADNAAATEAAERAAKAAAESLRLAVLAGLSR
ncbi:hypothetical protein [Devosia sp. SL43]|uniref:hypothetical protein n=1 Tax=Devosia sp. SL43 TaxID=2806348 RepID=UPI001F2A8F33|nr:hypothetical protein [Devosia sp. SL43]UJW84323.1 hypothetical protein IM737_12865 [Devosia sp. SL43]